MISDGWSDDLDLSFVNAHAGSHFHTNPSEQPSLHLICFSEPTLSIHAQSLSPGCNANVHLAQTLDLKTTLSDRLSLLSSANHEFAVYPATPVSTICRAVGQTIWFSNRGNSRITFWHSVCCQRPGVVGSELNIAWTALSCCRPSEFWALEARSTCKWCASFLESRVNTLEPCSLYHGHSFRAMVMEG
jgi:hypothetical protein